MPIVVHCIVDRVPGLVAVYGRLCWLPLGVMGQSPVVLAWKFVYLYTRIALSMLYLLLCSI